MGENLFLSSRKFYSTPAKCPVFLLGMHASKVVRQTPIPASSNTVAPNLRHESQIAVADADFKRSGTEFEHAAQIPG